MASVRSPGGKARQASGLGGAGVGVDLYPKGRSARCSPALRPRSYPLLARAPALAAFSFIAVLIGGAFVGLILEAGTDPIRAFSTFDPYLWRVLRFTLWQAVLSTLLSVLPALLVARALARQGDFPGRGTILRLLALPLGLPPIVAALGVLALLGSNGYLAGLLATLGRPDWPGIYGLTGILIAHTFFNLPLATRFFLEALDTVPNDQWRLASQLGISAFPAFRLVEWPVLRAALPRVAGLVFMLCITSFTLVLTLGGGPAATTLEVAIYQALRFDFDAGRATALTLAQIGLTVAAVALLGAMGAQGAFEANPSASRRRHLRPEWPETLFNAALIGLAATLVAAPILAIVLAGLGADLSKLAAQRSVQTAAATSLALAAASALLATAMAFSLARSRRPRRLRPRRLPGRLLNQLGPGANLILVVPPVVIGAGWFVLLGPLGLNEVVAPAMVVAVNAAMALPFAARAIGPAFQTSAARHDRLCSSLGVAGLDRLRIIDWPVLKRPVATGFAFAMALSLGDLGVIAMFGSDSVQTLPYLLLARMGSYRTDDAAGLALLLAGICMVLFVLADRIAATSRV